MKATLNFKTQEQAERFAIAYGRNTMRGHVVGFKDVTVCNLTQSDKEFIDAYVEQLNN